MAVAEPPAAPALPQRPGARYLDTPTGLTVERVHAATDEELRTLHAWHAGKAGDDDGRPWWPMAIRRMPFETRLQLASDPAMDAAWETLERRRVAASAKYLLLSYGHMQDEEGGAPTPFIPWPEQLDVIDLMAAERRLIVLKARQLGLTWIALHHAVHLQAFKPETPRAMVLALSKTHTDARKLLRRARRINLLLPPFLRLVEDVDTRRSNDRFKLVGRGEIQSLPGVPDSARSETAALILLDEVAFYRNGGFDDTWTAAQPTVGKKGQAIVISTGNGPATAPGDGQGFAKLWQQARAGATPMATVFLAASTDPARTQVWRDEEVKTYLVAEKFEAEHPETEEQALAGISGTKVFLPSGINAAENMGREFDQLRAEMRMPEPVGGLLEVSGDWGELTHLLLIWPLEGGGLYVMAEYAPDAGPGIEPGRATREILKLAREIQRIREPTGLRDPWPLIGAPRYDSAGVQSMRTFLATAENDPMLARQFSTRRRRGVPKIPTIKISFAEYKDVGKDYLKYLFRRAGQDQATGIIAVSPACPVLLRQLRGLEVVEDGSGKIKKGDDHGPDALIADAVPHALRFLGREQLDEDEMG